MPERTGPAHARPEIVAELKDGRRLCGRSRCPECDPLPSDPQALRQLQDDALAMQQLRRISWQSSHSTLRDEEMFRQVAQLLGSGALHVCVPKREKRLLQSSADGAGAAFPLAERRRGSARSESEGPDPDTLPASASLLAMAESLSEAATLGAAACPL